MLSKLAQDQIISSKPAKVPYTSGGNVTGHELRRTEHSRVPGPKLGAV